VQESYRHPAFPQPQEPTAVLWRYMSGERFKWLVECERLSMPAADRLGDPLEGSTPHGELEWWKRQAAGASNEEHRRIVEHNRTFLSKMAKEWRSHCYISCWHMNPYENHGMWGCYTTQPESVSIRTTYLTLRECLPNYIEMGMVRYLDYANDRLPDMNMFQYVMHKDIYYGFEHEVRAVGFPRVAPDPAAADFHANLFELETTPGFRILAPPVDVRRLVQAVVLHPAAPVTFQSKMAEFCTANNLPKPELSRRNRTPVF
jgi:hypothetical protein